MPTMMLCSLLIYFIISIFLNNVSGSNGYFISSQEQMQSPLHGSFKIKSSSSSPLTIFDTRNLNLLDEEYANNNTNINKHCNPCIVVLHEGKRHGPISLEQVLDNTTILISYFQMYPVPSIQETLKVMKLGESISDGCKTTFTLEKIQEHKNIVIFNEYKAGNVQTCPV